MNRKNVFKRFARFRDSIESVDDDPRADPT